MTTFKELDLTNPDNVLPLTLEEMEAKIIRMMEWEKPPSQFIMLIHMAQLVRLIREEKGN